jgi:Reverse transcriptase (RNA-dependent DNA polymerase)/Retroviral aspartyl protease
MPCTERTLDNMLSKSLYSIRSMLQGQSNKRQRLDQALPIVPGLLQKESHPTLATRMTILLDSGASQSIIHNNILSGHSLEPQNVPTTWNTVAGKFVTKFKAKVAFKLPTLHASRVIETMMHVTDTISNYDMIIGRDLLQELGIVLHFGDQTIAWDNALTPMKNHASISNNDLVATESETGAIADATERMNKILEAKYAPENTNDVVTECKHLSKNEQLQLLVVLNKYKSLFDGTLGHWQGETYDITLKPDAKPYHARPYPIPKAYEDTLKLEVERLCKIGVLKRINHSEWGSPTFIIPKKDKTVRFISDFHELNKRIKPQPFPLPKIQDLLLKLEGFQFATSLDLNMGYYHIELSPHAKQLCTIVLRWGKYEYQRLPMGLCNSPDIFQEKMSVPMADLEHVRAYIDDLLIISKGSFQEHLQKLDIVLQRLQQAGLKINATKSWFAQEQLEYLG